MKQILTMNRQIIVELGKNAGNRREGGELLGGGGKTRRRRRRRKRKRKNMIYMDNYETEREENKKEE